MWRFLFMAVVMTFVSTAELLPCSSNELSFPYGRRTKCKEFVERNDVSHMRPAFSAQRVTVEWQYDCFDVVIEWAEGGENRSRGEKYTRAHAKDPFTVSPSCRSEFLECRANGISEHHEPS